MFSLFDTLPDRDRQTDRRTDTSRQQIPRYAEYRGGTLGWRRCATRQLQMLVAALLLDIVQSWRRRSNIIHRCSVIGSVSLNERSVCDDVTQSRFQRQGRLQLLSMWSRRLCRDFAAICITIVRHHRHVGYSFLSEFVPNSY